MLDGINNWDNMSVVKLSVVSACDTTIAEQGNRYSVTLQLQFFNEVDAAGFQARCGATQVDKLSWQTIVHVEDKDKFAEFVEWKGNDTQRQWHQYNEVLGNTLCSSW
eukprot:scaffold421366_cov58-Attheya_sp.AAC.1